MASNDELIRAYREAEREILATIQGKDFIDRLERTKTLYQVKKILYELENPTEEWIIRNSASEWETGAKEVRKALKGVGYKGSFNLVDKKASEFVLESLSSIQDTANSEVRQVLSNTYTGIEMNVNRISRAVQAEYSSKVASDIAQKMAIKQALGTPRKKIAEEITNKLKSDGLTAVNWTNEKGQHRKMSLEAYIKRLTQKVLTNSHTSSVVSQTLQSGYDLVIVSKHKNPSDLCAELEGQILSITGLTPGYKVLGDVIFKGRYAPPALFHDWCRHSIAIYIPTSIEFK